MSTPRHPNDYDEKNNDEYYQDLKNKIKIRKKVLLKEFLELTSVNTIIRQLYEDQQEECENYSKSTNEYNNTVMLHCNC